ncbi:unnamed protein product [Sphenostylis stenocarpa]|uniref:peptidylprolyl isomerase n=1 Tax=Sphenostylis stenocarpa TaxID=92480 RepID=A0AA86VEX8_9FABA|nr:unnamed protein product [Sphenostylis stenocarpa]
MYHPGHKCKMEFMQLIAEPNDSKQLVEESTHYLQVDAPRKMDVMTQNNDEADDQTEAKIYGNDFITSPILENRPKRNRGAFFILREERNLTGSKNCGAYLISFWHTLSLGSGCHRCKQRVDEFIMPSLNCRRFGLSWKLKLGARNILKRQDIKCLPAGGVLSDAGISSNQFEDFSVSVVDKEDTRELKISLEVSGNKTQRIFDDVFKRMVAAAQPIPGFRRVKGGGIPKDILLEVLGPSKVFKEVIKKIINSTVAEYVEKENLTVSKDLRVEQSFEDLETTFVEGERFSFDVVLELKK